MLVYASSDASLQEVKVLQEETTQEENRYHQITSMTEASGQDKDKK